jgi:hypothetical protein
MNNWPTMPAAIARLPQQEGTGYPIPWFVADVNGKADFRVVRAERIPIALRERRCFICGGLLIGLRAMTPRATFPIGPMCTITRTSAEPPSHRACAHWAAQVCPFLLKPGKERRETNIPERAEPAAGISIPRNPGVIALWESNTYHPEHVANGTLFKIGDPLAVTWMSEGRPATRAEVIDSIDSGLPALTGIADQDGPAAVAALKFLTAAAMHHLPAETVS